MTTITQNELSAATYIDLGCQLSDAEFHEAWGLDDFKEFLRNPLKVEQISADIRKKIFVSAPSGSSDINIKNLEELLNFYGVTDISVHQKHHTGQADGSTHSQEEPNNKATPFEIYRTNAISNIYSNNLPVQVFPSSRNIEELKLVFNAEDFVRFWHDDYYVDDWSADDHMELFSLILSDPSLITVELLGELASNYDLDFLPKSYSD